MFNFEVSAYLFKIKEGENFNRPSTICQTYGAGRNTQSILRIALICHISADFERGRFAKVSCS